MIYFQEEDMLEKRNYNRVVEKLLNFLDLVKFSSLRIEVVPHVPKNILASEKNTCENVRVNERKVDKDTNKINLE